jgi:hypothetical protein
VNDESDHFARWVQGICAIPLTLFVLVEIYFLFSGSFFGIWAFFKGGLGIGAIYLTYRCLKYAITGRDNINRDDF